MSQSEYDRLISSDHYHAGDPDLVTRCKRARPIMRDYNTTVHGEDARRAKLLEHLFGYSTDAVIRPPFYVDHGSTIRLGRGIFFQLRLRCARRQYRHPRCRQ